MEGPTDPGLFRPLPADHFPIHFGGSQFTFTLDRFRICSIVNLPHFLVPVWLKSEESTWAEPQSKAIKGKAEPQTASQPNGRSVDVPDVT